MVEMIPIPSNLDLFLDVSINIPGCNCQFHNCSAGWFEEGCSNGRDGQTTIIDREFNEVEHTQVPSNMRLVVDKTNRILKTRTTISSLIRLKSPKKENRTTVATYYNGLKGQVRDGLICGNLDADQAKKVLEVVFALEKVNLFELYAYKEPLRIGELNRTSRSLKRIDSCSKTLCDLIIDISGSDFTNEKEKKTFKQKVSVLSTLDDSDLTRIQKRLNAVPNRIEDVTPETIPIPLNQWDAEKLVSAAREMAGVTES